MKKTVATTDITDFADLQQGMVQLWQRGMAIVDNGFPAPCWMLPPVANRKYGKVSVKMTEMKSHRLSFAYHNGPLIKGMTIDHLCEFMMCQQPDHLEQVTPAENTRRAKARSGRHPNSHTPRGHYLSDYHIPTHDEVLAVIQQHRPNIQFIMAKLNASGSTVGRRIRDLRNQEQVVVVFGRHINDVTYHPA